MSDVGSRAVLTFKVRAEHAQVKRVQQPFDSSQSKLRRVECRPIQDNLDSGIQKFLFEESAIPLKIWKTMSTKEGRGMYNE